MTGRHAATGQDRDRPRQSAFWGEGTRERVTDAAAVICGAGVALTGTEMDSLAGAGVVLGGVAIPAVWLSLGSARLRRELRSEQVARRRGAAMAAAQDARVQALRQRVRELDLAQATSHAELRAATTGLLATKVELTAMRSELDEARDDLGRAREQLVEVREQLTALLSARPAGEEPADRAAAGASGPAGAGVAVPHGPAADPLQELVLPSGVSDPSVPAEQRPFAAFAESDLDDLTGILSVSAMLDHAREQAREQERTRARGLADSSGDADGRDEVPADAATDAADDVSSAA